MAQKSAQKKADRKVRKQEKQQSSKLWSAMSLGSGLLAAMAARKVLDGTWRAATGKTPPANPADPDVDVWEAVAWATASGTFIGVARMLAGRRAARYYQRSTGHLPPELQADAVKEARAAAEVAQEESGETAREAARKGRRARRNGRR